MYLCIDVGGTKTIVAMLDKRGKILHSIKFATLPDEDAFYANLIQQIKINFVLASVKYIAVALPGVVKDNRAVWYGNLPWQNLDIAARLEADFGLPTVVENDANLAALAEARRHHGRSLYLTFSTGIGGGIIENGKIPAKFQDFEPGHTVYVHRDQSAEWEDIASGKAIRDFYGRNADEITDPKAWQEVAQRINLGLAPLLLSLKPKTVIFGGPVGLALANYRRPLRKLLKSELGQKTILPRFQIAKYGNMSVIYGCYFYAKTHFTAK